MARTAPVAASSTTTAPCVAPGRRARPGQQRRPAAPRPPPASAHPAWCAASRRYPAAPAACAWSAAQSANQPGAIGGVGGKAISAAACLACASVIAPSATIAASTSPPARRRGLGIAARVEARRRARQPGQHRRLPQASRAAPRRRNRSAPPRPCPRRRSRDRPGSARSRGSRCLVKCCSSQKRQHQLLHLAPEGARVGQEQVLRHLLGDGRAALHDVPGAAGRSPRRGARPIRSMPGSCQNRRSSTATAAAGR